MNWPEAFVAVGIPAVLMMIPVVFYAWVFWLISRD